MRSMDGVDHGVSLTRHSSAFRSGCEAGSQLATMYLYIHTWLQPRQYELMASRVVLARDATGVRLRFWLSSEERRRGFRADGYTRRASKTSKCVSWLW